jgi:1-pyrroline-5-carboxylate dehydrogenase
MDPLKEEVKIIPEKKVTYVSMERDETLHRAYEEALGKVAGEFGQSHTLFIGGRGVRTGKEFELRSPIDRDILIGTFQQGGEDEARGALREAKEAFPEWSGREWRGRAAIIRRTADRLEADRFLLAALIT